MNTKVVFAFFYSMATFGAWLTIKYTPHNQVDSLLQRLYLADLVGALVTFVFCIFSNSFSIYDPYWSVQCVAIIFYFCSITSRWLSNLRVLITIGLVTVWAYHLTAQCLNGLPHYDHEDWRYSDFGKKIKSHGLVYYFVGFFAFILLPTTVVYFGCAIPLYYIIHVNVANTSLNLVDTVAFLVTLTGILFENIADIQLRKHLEDKKSKGQTISTGLWSLSRHPNYFGEITFWVGLYLIGIGSDFNLIHDKFYLTSFILGAFAIFSIIYFGSLPMMEERQLNRRRETYTKYMNNVRWKLLPISFI